MAAEVELVWPTELTRQTCANNNNLFHNIFGPVAVWQKNVEHLKKCISIAFNTVMNNIIVNNFVKIILLGSRLVLLLS